MTTLGTNGRFGNQLIQYAFIRFHAEDHGLLAELPDWIGRDLFDLTDPYPSGSLPVILEEDFGSQSGQTLSDCNVCGFFASKKKEWKTRASEFRALFTPGGKVAALLDHALSTLSDAGKTIVAVHLRRADFGHGAFWIAPAGWYLAWLRSIWTQLDQPVLYIATDEVTLIPRFAEFSPWDSRRLGIEIPGADFMIDHHILRHADHVAISNSTFSYTRRC